MKTAITEFSGDYRWLSNFHKVQIEAFGYTFGSVEAAYQAAKEIFSLNREEVVLQFTQDTAGEAKSRGAGAARKLRRRPDLLVEELPLYWDKAVPGHQHPLKVLVMWKLLKAKFKNPELRSLLLGTGDAPLIEGNTWGDTFWGVYGTTGSNVLGQLLMKLRANMQMKERAYGKEWK